MELHSLSQICPSWSGRLISSAFSDLQRGIERENARLNNLSFVTLAFRSEYDYDGLMETLVLHEGFSDLSAAVRCVEQLADKALADALAQPSYGSYQWQLEEWSDASKRKPRTESDTVSSVFSKSFKVATGSGYDSMYSVFQVLHVTTPEMVGPELFSFVNAESEWVRFLITRGKEADSPRG